MHGTWRIYSNLAQVRKDFRFLLDPRVTICPSTEITQYLKFLTVTVRRLEPPNPMACSIILRLSNYLTQKEAVLLTFGGDKTYPLQYRKINSKLTKDLKFKS